MHASPLQVVDQPSTESVHIIMSATPQLGASPPLHGLRLHATSTFGTATIVSSWMAAAYLGEAVSRRIFALIKYSCYSSRFTRLHASPSPCRISPNPPSTSSRSSVCGPGTSTATAQRPPTSRIQRLLRWSCENEGWMTGLSRACWRLVRGTGARERPFGGCYAACVACRG